MFKKAKEWAGKHCKQCTDPRLKAIVVEAWMAGYEAGRAHPSSSSGAGGSEGVRLKPFEKEALKQIADEEWREMVHEWLIYKRERKESYKGATQVLALYRRMRKLAEDDPVQARANLDFSMGNNYSGLFADTQRGSLSPTPSRPLPTSPSGEEERPLPASPLGEEKKREVKEARQEMKPAALPEGWWRLTGLDKKSLWEVMQAARQEVSEQEYKHWIEPVAAADLVERDTLIIPYYGSGYRGQNPMQAMAFLAMLKHLRKVFEGRIANARAEWKR